MHPDLGPLFDRQKNWQRSRAQLPWPEKIRMSEAMREAARHLRSVTRNRPGGRAGACPGNCPPVG